VINKDFDNCKKEANDCIKKHEEKHIEGIKASQKAGKTKFCTCVMKKVGEKKESCCMGGGRRSAFGGKSKERIEYEQGKSEKEAYMAEADCWKSYGEDRTTAKGRCMILAREDAEAKAKEYERRVEAKEKVWGSNIPE